MPVRVYKGQPKSPKPRKPRRWIFFCLLISVSMLFGLGKESANDEPIAKMTEESPAEPDPVEASLVLPLTPPPESKSTRIVGYIANKENLTEALMGENISRPDVLELIDVLRRDIKRTSFNPNIVQRGDRYELLLDDRSAIQYLKYTRQNDHETQFIVERINGQLKARQENLPLKREAIIVSGRIKDNIWGALRETGENPALLCDKLEYVFEYYIDFYNDCRTGDQFTFAVEKFYGKSGAFVRYGDILAAQYEGDKESFQAFLYVDPSGEDSYYDSKGRSLQGLFLRKPLNFTRISSPFTNRRYHPILKKYTRHHGVDYAAPYGTKVWAIANGTVTFVGRKGPLGNYIEIEHNNGYKTGYGHLSKYARGLKKGQRVKQKQTIGYVGSTGRSTGPHLHFNFYATINGTYKLINPTRKINRPAGQPIPAKYMAHFRQQRDQYFALLDRKNGVIVTAALPLRVAE